MEKENSSKSITANPINKNGLNEDLRTGPPEDYVFPIQRQETFEERQAFSMMNQMNRSQSEQHKIIGKAAKLKSFGPGQDRGDNSSASSAVASPTFKVQNSVESGGIVLETPAE